MDRTLRIGIIGCGGFTSGKHLPNLYKNPHFQIAALCDLNEKQLGTLQSTYSPDYTTPDFHKVIADPGIDCLLVGTKPSFRIPILQEAVARKKPVFVEKPMSIDLEDTFEIYHLMNKSDIPFMVGFNRPYSPAMREVKRLYRDLLSHRADSHNGNTMIYYRIIGESRLWPEHHRNAVYGGESTIIHEVTHIFDLLNWLTEKEPTRVYVTGGGTMDNIISLTYPGSISAVIVSGDNCSLGVPKEFMEITSNHASIQMRSFIEVYSAGIHDKASRVCIPYDLDGRKKTSTYQSYEDLLWNIRTSITDEEKAHGYYYHKLPGEDKGHYNELEHFYRCIIDGKPTETGHRRGAVSTITALTSIESLRKQQALELDVDSVLTPPEN